MRSRTVSWRNTRLVPAAVATWAAAVAAVTHPTWAAAQTLLLGVLGVGLGVGWIVIWRAGTRRGRITSWPPPARFAGASVALSVGTVALAAAMAVSAHVALTVPARETALAAFGAGARSVDVEAVVVGKVEPRGGGLRAFDASVRLLDGEGATLSGWVEGDVRIPEELLSSEIDVGAVVRVSGTSRPAYGGARAVVQIVAAEVRIAAPPEGVLGMTAHLRQSLVNAASGLPGGGGELIPGLAVGDTSAVTPATDAAMKTSSLAHLTAVSGANCALVVGIAFVTAARMGARRSTRVAAGVCALVGFVILVTPEPSVVRAATMAGIAMLAVLLGRTGAGVALLTASVVVLLLFDPWLSSSLGFALSVAATAALLTLARPLASGLERHLPRPLALALAVPLAAQLACGPLLLLIDPSVSLWGVPANLLAAPAAPVATVLGLAACLAAPIPLLQSGLTALTWVPAAWISAVAHLAAALPFARLPWMDGLPGIALLAGCTTLVVLTITLRGDSVVARRVRTWVALALAATVATWICGVVGAELFARWSIPATWSIIACDIGQGDALLVRSGSALALIDTGPEPESLTACLHRVGIEHLDLVILTHFDKDHVGGAAAIVGKADVVVHGPTGEDADGQLLEALADGGAALVAAEAGMTGSLGAARWVVYWPRASNPFPPGNDSSVTVTMEGGGIPRSLFLGDLPADPQRILRSSLPGVFEVVKVSHHGSADQDAGLYQQISARIALIGVGAGNTYGHPTDLALQMLGDSAVGRTDQNGMLAVTGSGPTLALWRERMPTVGGAG